LVTIATQAEDVSYTYYIIVARGFPWTFFTTLILTILKESNIEMVKK